MKLVVNGSEFAAAMQIVKRAVATRPIFSATGMVSLVAEEDQLKLAANDTTLYIATHIPAEIEMPGRVLVSPKIAAVAEKSERVTMELKEHWLHVVGYGRLEAATMDYDSFVRPEMPEEVACLPVEARHVTALTSTVEANEDVMREANVAVHTAGDFTYLSIVSLYGGLAAVVVLPRVADVPEVFLSRKLLHSAFAATGASAIHFGGEMAWLESEDSIAVFPVTAGTPYHIDELLGRYQVFDQLAVCWSEFKQALELCATFSLSTNIVTLVREGGVLTLRSQGSHAGYFEKDIPCPGAAAKFIFHTGSILVAMKALREGAFDLLTYEENVALQIGSGDTKFLLSHREKREGA